VDRAKMAMEIAHAAEKSEARHAPPAESASRAFEAVPGIREAVGMHCQRMIDVVRKILPQRKAPPKPASSARPAASRMSKTAHSAGELRQPDSR
jgi:hypothetical protein